MANILVVDDVPDNITLLGFNLEDDGHTVIAANSGTQCLEIVAQEKPDIILLDIMMPGMSGIETLQALKHKESSYRNIPVIMISANDSEDSIVEALDLGAHDYVGKPCIYPILAARMRSALRLSTAQKKLKASNQALEKLASTDSLTGAYNRRQFLTLSNAELAKSGRFQRPLSMIMLDADFFKQVNDHYGHAMGDLALKHIIDTCHHVTRESDIVGRLGGEEFAVCCPETDIDGARGLAERLRAAIAADIIEREQQQCQLTVSLGVATLTDKSTSIEQLLSLADEALYRSKHQGRNRVSTNPA